MKIHREYHRILDAIIKHPKYRFVSGRPLRRFWGRLSINHLRFILAKLEESLKVYGLDTRDGARGPTAWFAMVLRCPSAGKDEPCMRSHFGHAHFDAFDGSEAHKLCTLYVLLVRVLHLRERQAATRLAKPLPQLKRRRIPSPRPASSFFLTFRP